MQSSTNTTEPPIVSSTIKNKKPWDNLVADYIGPFPNGKYIFVIIDEYLRYPIAETISSANPKTATMKHDRIFSEFGIPKNLKTVHGPLFNNPEFTKCTHKRVTPYWPEANGNVERLMRNLKKVIQASVLETKYWQKGLNEYLINCHSTPHATTSRPSA